jgi:DNA repair exonuclease SbcCD ATPase subunit
MTKIQNYQELLIKNKGKLEHLQNHLKKEKIELAKLNYTLDINEQAYEMIKDVGLKTQKQLEFHIGDIASMAMDTVFPEPYILEAKFLERRNKSECDLRFVKNGEKIKPLDSSGYGAVDIACFALRVASWAMIQKTCNNTIILDEPMRFLSENYQTDASVMLKEISDKLGIQFIIVTHEPTIAQFADNTIQIAQKNHISYVK